MNVADTRRVTAKKLDSLAQLAELHVRSTESGFNISEDGWAEKFTAPREVYAFLRGYIRGREASSC